MKELPKLFQLTKNQFHKSKMVYLNQHVKTKKHEVTNQFNSKVEIVEEKYYEAQDTAEYLYIMQDMLEYCLNEMESAKKLLVETFNKNNVSTVYMTDYDKKVFIDKETKEVVFEPLNEKDKKRIMKNSNIEYLKTKNC